LSFPRKPTEINWSWKHLLECIVKAFASESQANSSAVFISIYEGVEDVMEYVQR
jgi:hypothetical protein